MTEPAGQAGWRERLRQEELNGFAFAFKARSGALAVIVLWVVVSSTWSRLPMLMAAAAAFFAVGWVAYAARGHRHTIAIQGACAFADVAILVLASHFPERDWNEWALQSWMRRSAFLYLVAYIACSALTFSVTVVLLSGLAAVLGQLASFVFVIYAAEHVDMFKGFATSGAYDLLRQLTSLQNVEPWVFMVNQLVLLGVTTGLIAGAIWRARRHVERAVQAEARSTTLGRYFSPDVAQRLADEPASLETGRAQDAAVLFVDIIGSTRRMEALPPEQVIEAVRAYHQRIVPIVFRHGGSIDKFLGDGVMAVFGAPEKSPSAAYDAVLCAVVILDTIDAWSADRVARGNVATTVGIGIHYGPVVQGNVGIADRLEFTTLGDTVNLASRLEGMTRQVDSGILLSHEALDAAERLAPLPPGIKARCRDLGPLPIAGHEAPIHVFGIARKGSP
ncbi:MAG: adenylate/guanylate cyclase domain-containing protein [Enhydrobacter sp.]|nr:MAG: adenylate/guanylate cyclase domain-containing protein [Enhydrobacter sp.]